MPSLSLSLSLLLLFAGLAWRISSFICYMYVCCARVYVCMRRKTPDLRWEKGSNGVEEEEEKEGPSISDMNGRRKHVKRESAGEFNPPSDPIGWCSFSAMSSNSIGRVDAECQQPTQPKEEEEELGKRNVPVAGTSPAPKVYDLISVGDARVPPLLPPSYIVCEWKLYLLIKLRHLIAQRAPTLSRPVLFLIQRTSLGSYIHSTNLGRRRRCRPCCVLAFTLATKSGKAIRSSLH